MRKLLLTVFVLLCCLQTGSCLAATDLRVLRAGNTILRVEVVDVVDARGAKDLARIDMLHRWVRDTAEAVKTPSGHFALPTAYVRVRQVDSRDRSPVPWGQTQRTGGVGVLLFVRKDATAQALRADWTATHELSHLFHPYLGENGRWLAEGLASYLQNTLRARAGLLPADKAWTELDAGFQRGQAASAGSRMDQTGRSRASTMRIYWAGAAFWLETDLALRRQGKSLDAVLDAYARCCLDGRATVSPQAFIAALDQVAGNDLLGRLYRIHAAAQNFPSLQSAYRELGIAREQDSLRFSMQAGPRRLRAAIMQAPGQSSATRPQEESREP